MPMIWLTTNVKLESDDAFKAFISEFGQLAVQAIQKPIHLFTIDCHYNPFLMCRGTFEPAVMVQTMSLSNTTPENTLLWSKTFSDFFYEKLGVPPERAGMVFSDPGPDFASMEGTSVAVLRAKASKQG